VCSGSGISYRIVDITQLGVPAGGGFPHSLGMRPQAVKLKLVGPGTGGDFMRFSLKVGSLLARAGRCSDGSGAIFHRAFIGEAFSVIYLPVYEERGELFDGVTGQSLDNTIPRDDIVRSPMRAGRYLPAVCPNCGWNLDDNSGCVVFTCSNCSRAWETVGGRLAEVTVEVPDGNSEKVRHLPFWRVPVSAPAGKLETLGDFIRLTRQPVTGRGLDAERSLDFYVPAFKIRPKIFLALARRMTLGCRRSCRGSWSSGAQLHPVSLGRREAVQCRKLVLAECAVDKKRVFPMLPTLKFRATEASLVYIPFIDTKHELIDAEGRIGISKRALDLGNYL
jgi:hypothetical protein